MTKHDMSQVALLDFHSENLAHAIQKAFPSLFPDSTHLKEELDQYVFPRLDFMAGDERKSYLFLFEARYVETEWKDMISMHYINTSYEVENTVMRVHLFKKAELCEKNYRGCFTMRTIDEAHIMLSYIYPNWEYVVYNGNSLNVMTYRKKVHINGRIIEFHTYPLFVQDNTVVACAEASLISMSKYLHSKYDYTKIRINSINSAYHSNRTKSYPSSGLLPTQMLEILYKHNIQCGYQIYNENSEFKEYIDYCIESAIPILIGICIANRQKGRGGHHVIQIIGHSDVNTGKKYVVYDDSGYYLRNIGELARKKTSGFVGCVSWEVLSKSLKDGTSFIIYPIHEKVYILYDNFIKHMNDMLYRMHMNDSTLHEYVREEAKRLLQIDMPHYLWCCEYSMPAGSMLFIVNPTYIRSTTKNIFLNKDPLICKSQISLLRYEENCP